MAKRKKDKQGKKRADKKLRESVAGSPYYEELMDDLINLRDNIGKIRVLSEDEYQIRKYEVGLTTDVPKAEMKRERRRINRKPKSRKEVSLDALKKYINKSLNILLESRYSIHFDGMMLTVMDIQKSTAQEHRFCYISSNSIYAENSFLSKWLEVFDVEERFKKDINLRKGEVRSGYWVETDHRDRENVWGMSDYNMMEGGFVDVKEATYKKYDMIPAMLCRNEFVFTQEAVRGAGRGMGHAAGAWFLTVLMDHYEREAKKYPHTQD